MEVVYKFKGNIEGDVAICNVSECTKHSSKPNTMILPSEFCREELGDEIHITKRNFNFLEKNGRIIYN